MCNICQRTICAPRCPNAEYKIIGACAQCHSLIGSDEEYYIDDDDNVFCDMDCAADFYGIRMYEG